MSGVGICLRFRRRPIDWRLKELAPVERGTACVCVVLGGGTRVSWGRIERALSLSHYSLPLMVGVSFFAGRRAVYAIQLVRLLSGGELS